MMTITNLTELLMAHLQGNLSGAGQEQLDEWLAQSERNRRLFESIDNGEQLRQLILLYDQEEKEDNEAIILSKIRKHTGAGMAEAPVRRMSTLRRRIWVAATTLLLAGIGGYSYFLINSKATPSPVTGTGEPADILPGREGAILTLADGSQVVLDSLGNGVVANQNGAKVLLSNGALSYTYDAGPAAPVYNNLTTPRGRQFQLILPDGTKAWLNAASSIRYPTAFAGNERNVDITGEAYFEVQQLRNKAGRKIPFKVSVLPSTGGAGGGCEVEVLGTHFNMNAYDDEPDLKVTLLEGSVIVKSGLSRVKIKPGEQAVLTAHLPTGQAGSPLAIDYSPNIEKVMAWKSGLFNFEDASFEEVMRQLERWYDIEVVYEKGIPDIRFGGKVSNDVSLPGLLKSLRESGVHCRLEGRKLIVLP